MAPEDHPVTQNLGRPTIARRRAIWNTMNTDEKREARALMGPEGVKAYLQGIDLPFAVRATVEAAPEARTLPLIRQKREDLVCTHSRRPVYDMPGDRADTPGNLHAHGPTARHGRCKGTILHRDSAERCARGWVAIPEEQEADASGPQGPAGCAACLEAADFCPTCHEGLGVPR